MEVRRELGVRGDRDALEVQGTAISAARVDEPRQHVALHRRGANNRGSGDATPDCAEDGDGDEQQNETTRDAGHKFLQSG